MRRSALAAVAAIGSATLLMAGCSKADDSKSDNGGTKAAGANAATKDVVNASTHKGGTVTYELSDVPDSFDPGNTYYAYMYNFSRLYARPLMTFEPGPGSKGNTLVPDLAASKGVSSDGGKTWTYKLRSGLKYQDGTAITSKDVKYAVERSNFARDVLSSARTTSSSSWSAARTTRARTRTRAPRASSPSRRRTTPPSSST